MQGAIGRTADKGLKEFATHCVAQLMNTTSLRRALDIFKCMCHVFYSKANTQCVNQCLKKLHNQICGIKIPEDTLNGSRQWTTTSFQRQKQYWPSLTEAVMSDEDPEEETEMKNKYHLSSNTGYSVERLHANFSTLVRYNAW